MGGDGAATFDFFAGPLHARRQAGLLPRDQGQGRPVQANLARPLRPARLRLPRHVRGRQEEGPHRRGSRGTGIRTSLSDPLATDVAADKTNVMSMSDVLTYSTTKARIDSFAISELLAIDFVPGGFTDSFSFADSETIDTSLSKSDNFSFADSEVLSTALGKSDSFSFTDNQVLSTSLNKSDSVSFADAQALANAMAKSDSLNITETHSFSLGKSAQDSATISESISILNANRQSALNASALNSNTLN